MDVGGSGLSLGLGEPPLQWEPARVAHQEPSAVGHAGPVPWGVPQTGGLLVCVVRGQYRAREQPVKSGEEMGCGLYLLVFANLHKHLWAASTRAWATCDLSILVGFQDLLENAGFCRKRPVRKEDLPAPHHTPKPPKSVGWGLGDLPQVRSVCPRARLLMVCLCPACLLEAPRPCRSRCGAAPSPQPRSGRAPRLCFPGLGGVSLCAEGLGVWWRSGERPETSLSSLPLQACSIGQLRSHPRCVPFLPRRLPGRLDSEARAQVRRGPSAVGPRLGGAACHRAAVPSRALLALVAPSGR